MTSVSKYVSVNAPSPQNISFGAHRDSDHPASAIRAGASSMPSAWQNQNAPYDQGRTQSGDQVRSLLDIACDPLRWMMATKAHKVISLAVITTGLLVWLF